MVSPCTGKPIVEHPTEVLACRTWAARDLGKQSSFLPPFETAHEWAAFLSIIQNLLTSYLFFTL